MDYCHPCRRHLNGALTCPGCGASADPLRAYPRDVYTPEPRPGASDGPGDHDTPGGGGHVGHEAQGDGREAPEADGDESRGRAARRRGQGRGGRRGGGDAAGAGPADASDASRRDRKAAVHRRRRRRAVLITAGFVLAAGGLSLAELGVDAPGFSSRPNPAAAGGESSEVDDSAAEPSTSAQPLDDRKGAGKDETSASPSASASASPSASDSPDAEDASRTPDKEAQSATVPGSSSGATAPSGSTPTAAPTTSDPSPDPSPSETCTRFLWWCS